MRAIYVPTVTTADFVRTSPHPCRIALSPTAGHHLKNVVRLRPTEEIKILNGQGLVVVAIVQQFVDDQLEVIPQTWQQAAPPRPWDLVVGLTKDFDEVVRLAQELGVRRLYPWNSLYSVHPATKQLVAAATSGPSSAAPILDRWQRIMIAAMEQSNHPWPLELDLRLCCLNKEEGQEKLRALAAEYPQVFTAHLDRPQDHGLKANQQTPLLLIIGPEGGLGEHEVQVMQQIPANKLLSLPTPILRTPTAVSTLYGHLLG